MLADDKEITITDLILFLKKYFLVIVLVPISISIITYYCSALLPKYYASKISFFTKTGASKSSSGIPAFVMGGMSNPLDGFKKNDDNFVDINELLKSKRLLLSVAEKENIKDFYNTKTNKKAIGIMKKNFAYSIDEKSSLEILAFKSKDPVFTKKILDATFQEIQILNNQIVTEKTKIKVKFFEDKIKETIEKLNESEELIYSNKFKGQAFTSLDAKNELGIRARIYEQIRSLESELEVQKNIYGDDSRLIQQLRNKIEVLEKNSNFKPLGKEKIENVKEWREIYRDYLYYSAALRSHINNFEIAKLEEAGSSFLTILDDAEILEKPNLPNRKKLRLYAFILSFLLTGSLLIVYEYFVRMSDEDKRKILGE